MAIIKRYYTKESFKQAVELARAEGHIFRGYTYDCACFDDLILVRCY